MYNKYYRSQNLRPYVIDWIDFGVHIIHDSSLKLKPRITRELACTMIQAEQNLLFPMQRTAMSKITKQDYRFFKKFPLYNKLVLHMAHFTSIGVGAITKKTS